MCRGVRIGGAPRSPPPCGSGFCTSPPPPGYVTPRGQIMPQRLDLTHSRQTSLACDSVYPNKVYSYSILSKRGSHCSRNDEGTADLTQKECDGKEPDVTIRVPTDRRTVHHRGSLCGVSERRAGTRL